MAVDIRPLRTAKFRDPWIYVAWAAVGLIFVAGLTSLFLRQSVVNTTVSAEPEEPAELAPIKLPRAWLGATRIDVKAVIPDNRWLTYEIQILDAKGAPLGSAIKQAWRESGTWYEEGESGSWAEDDLWGGLDVRSATKDQTGPVTIAVNVLEYGLTSGQEIEEPVSFRVQVSRGVIDSRYLWGGFFGSLVLAVLASLSVGQSGKKVIAKKIDDSDVGDRAVVGGPNRLVRVSVDVASDETSPQSLQVNLYLKNGDGDQIYARPETVKLTLHKDEDGKLDRATGHLDAFFVLEPRGSYGFYATVMPDAPVDSTRLTVRDGAVTRQPVDVITLRQS
ncbi:hypothetical protein [Geitlerinema sp. PCC 7407]|uniref:hypothetical protein n=1 Tax=Geitlerinema sp. PCC 7407 TaxID=1173025 RepID=UPI00029FB2E3|nr:hypothetical protein [Geitlerinema sp. PCC 7407]AFY65389.1 hypothetical protein GEI7407_0891 [Geitlerinema sp. PCC 7407]